MTHLEKLEKEYEVDSFFDYIIESYVNGLNSQVKELSCLLTRKELLEFIDYLNEIGRTYIIKHLV